MSIILGGQTFTDEQLIAAIQASDNNTAIPSRSIDEVNGVLQAVLHRLSALEDRLPIARAGFAMTTIPGSDKTTYIVQSIDEQGRNIKTTYEVPNS